MLDKASWWPKIIHNWGIEIIPGMLQLLFPLLISTLFIVRRKIVYLSLTINDNNQTKATLKMAFLQMMIVDHGIKFGNITPAPTAILRRSRNNKIQMCVSLLTIRVFNFTFHMHHLITFHTLIIHVFHVLATMQSS